MEFKYEKLLIRKVGGNFSDEDEVTDELVVSKIIVNYRGLQKKKEKSRTLNWDSFTSIFKFLVHFKETYQKV